jgi:hypothetical protein
MVNLAIISVTVSTWTIEGCGVVSAAVPPRSLIQFSRPEPLLFFQVAPHLIVVKFWVTQDLNLKPVLTKGCLHTVGTITRSCIMQLIIQNNLAFTASMVSAFKANACLKTKNSILLSSCSEICQVPCCYRKVRYIPLNLPNNPNYILGRMRCYPYENWTKISYQRSRTPESGIVTQTKHSKESNYWLNQADTSNSFAVVQEESIKRQQRTSHSNTPKSLKQLKLKQLWKDRKGNTPYTTYVSLVLRYRGYMPQQAGYLGTSISVAAWSPAGWEENCWTVTVEMPFLFPYQGSSHYFGFQPNTSQYTPNVQSRWLLDRRAASSEYAEGSPTQKGIDSAISDHAISVAPSRIIAALYGALFCAHPLLWPRNTLYLQSLALSRQAVVVRLA